MSFFLFDILTGVLLGIYPTLEAAPVRLYTAAIPAASLDAAKRRLENYR